MKTKMAYDDALAIADVVKANLAGACERIEIAGSLRRKKPEIGDIELVAVPKMVPVNDMFGQVAYWQSLLIEVISANYQVIKGDEKYRQFCVDGMAVDVFMQPAPATWGVNMMIRTGCAEFSHWMVTSRQKGGAMPGWMRSEGARLWGGSKLLESPEEEDVFRLMGIRWIAPEERTCAYWGQVGRFLLPKEN